MTTTTPPDALPELGPGHGIRVTLDAVLGRRGMSVTELSRRTGVSRKNLDKLKNGRATGMTWSTLGAICTALECQPGDLLTHEAPIMAEHGPVVELPVGADGTPTLKTATTAPEEFH